VFVLLSFVVGRRAGKPSFALAAQWKSDMFMLDINVETFAEIFKFLNLTDQ
jgi:chloramphenicol 3-O-phosphotransferase